MSSIFTLRSSRTPAPGGPQSAGTRSRESEAKRDIEAGSPTVDLRTPEIGGPESDPLKLPELVEEIESQAAVNLVQMLHAESALETAKQVRATEVSTRFQLMALQHDAERHVDSTLLVTNPEWAPIST